MKITIDEAVEEINAAPLGTAHARALKCIKLLSREDRLMAAGDLESMAMLIDSSSGDQTEDEF